MSMVFKHSVAVVLLLACAVAWSGESTGKALGQLNESIELLKQPGGSTKAIPALQRLAAGADTTLRAEAWLWLGRAHRDGLGGTEKNAEAAFEYFERAAGRDGGNAEAQYELGRAYLNGEGTDRNIIAAYLWTEIGLKKPSKVTTEAQQQKEQLRQMLNATQLEKANELVQQLETLYLQNPQ